MAEEPDNIVLMHLRRLDEKVDALRSDAIEVNAIEVKERLGRMEREIANLHGDFAALTVRMDGLELRIEHIERRFDIVPNL